MSVTSKISLLFRAIDDGDLAENIDGAARHLFDHTIRCADGTTDGLADVVWSDRRTLGSTANEVIDLAGSLADSFGRTVTFVEVIGLLIVNRGTTAGAILHVGPDATNGLPCWWANDSDRSIVGIAIAGPPVQYGLLFKFAPVGFAVGAGATDELYIATPAAGTTYDIFVLGRSA